MLHFAPCVGQENPVGQQYRDSLYRHISREFSVIHSCHFVYGLSSSVVVPGLGSNSSELDRLDTFIRAALDHPEYSISHIRLTGYSSIEGGYTRNEALSRERAECFHSFLRASYPDLYRYHHSVAWVAEDWQGLSQLVKASSINEREEILEIIRKVPAFDERERLLAYLNGGRPYKVLSETIFPRLRRVELQIEFRVIPKVEAVEVDQLVYDVQEKDTVDLFEPTTSPYGDSYYGKAPTTSPLRGTPPRAGGELKIDVNQDSESSPGSNAQPKFAIKTNMLLWAGIQHDFKHTTPVANVALEYYISNHVSVELGAMYSYWRYNSNQEFQGISGYRLEPRYNFSLLHNRAGVFLGLYGRVGDYDIRKNNNTVNYTGDYWDAGLSAGISFRLVGGLALEVGARAGYVKTRPIKYMSDNPYNWFDGRYKYYQLKVTDLSVSLIYRFR